VLGGLARRTAFIETLRKERPVLVLDSGDLFFNPTQGPGDLDAARGRADVIARAYARMGAAAVNVGEMDLLGGLEFLTELGRHGVPLLSANVYTSEGRPAFKRYVVTTEEGVRIAITGVCQPHLHYATPTAFRERIRLRDPIEAVNEVLAEIRTKADIIILLSDLGIEADRGVARQTSGIDFILGGHQGRYEKWPRQERDTFVVQSYRKGMYVGRLVMTVEDPKAPFKNLNEAKEIEYEINRLDPRIQKIEDVKKIRPSPSVNEALDRLLGQKAALQARLKTVRAATGEGTRFEWSLDGIHATVPEDQRVAAWIRKAGIEKD